jgi:hypothetical protein
MDVEEHKYKVDDDDDDEEVLDVGSTSSSRLSKKEKTGS